MMILEDFSSTFDITCYRQNDRILHLQIKVFSSTSTSYWVSACKFKMHIFWITKQYSVILNFPTAYRSRNLNLWMITKKSKNITANSCNGKLDNNIVLYLVRPFLTGWYNYLQLQCHVHATSFCTINMSGLCHLFVFKDKVTNSEVTNLIGFTMIFQEVKMCHLIIKVQSNNISKALFSSQKMGNHSNLAQHFNLHLI